MSKNLTHNEFLEKLWIKNKHFRDGKFQVIGLYTNSNTKILVRDCYGDYSCHISSLLKGFTPSVKSLVSSLKQYIQKYLLVHNPHIVNKVEILSKTFNWHKMYFKTSYGIIKLDMKSLLNSKDISLKSAICKKDFWVRRSKDLREDSNYIDYTNCIYESNKHKVKLRCKIHNYEYKQRPSHHTAGAQGCPYCVKQTIKYSEENFKNHEDFFKGKKGFFYVLKLYDKNEMFYKIGITSQNKMKYRTEQLSKNYKVKIEYKLLDDLENCFMLEQRFLKEFEHFKYVPKKYFTGYTECLTVSPVDYYYYYQEQQNKLLYNETY